MRSFTRGKGFNLVSGFPRFFSLEATFLAKNESSASSATAQLLLWCWHSRPKRVSLVVVIAGLMVDGENSTIVSRLASEGLGRWFMFLFGKVFSENIPETAAVALCAAMRWSVPVLYRSDSLAMAQHRCCCCCWFLAVEALTRNVFLSVVFIK